MAVMSWTNFFFVLHFCYLGKILSIQIAQDPQKNKNIAIKILTRFKTYGKEILRETYGSTAPPLLEWVVEWYPLTPFIH